MLGPRGEKSAVGLIGCKPPGPFLLEREAVKVSDFIPSWGRHGLSQRWLLFSRSLTSNSLRPHGLQHAWLPCPSPSPRACSNSCPLSWWYHPTISSSAVPSSCLQSFLASGSFPVSQLFTSGGQRIGASASASVLPMKNIQG